MSIYDGYIMPTTCNCGSMGKVAGIVVDPSLTISGEAADAKVTGDYLRANQAELTNFSEQITSFSQRIDETNYEIEQIKESSSSIEEKISKLNSIKERIAKLEGQMELTIKQIDVRFNQVDLTVAALQERDKEIGDDLDNLRYRVLEDEKQISQNKADIAFLKAKICCILQSVKELEEGLATLKERVDVLDQEAIKEVRVNNVPLVKDRGMVNVPFDDLMLDALKTNTPIQKQVVYIINHDIIDGGNLEEAEI